MRPWMQRALFDVWGMCCFVALIWGDYWAIRIALTNRQKDSTARGLLHDWLTLTAVAALAFSASVAARRATMLSNESRSSLTAA
jgi:hypothetical protein